MGVKLKFRNHLNYRQFSVSFWEFPKARMDNKPQSFSVTDPVLELTELSVQAVHSTSSNESLNVSGPHS